MGESGGGSRGREVDLLDAGEHELGGGEAPVRVLLERFLNHLAEVRRGPVAGGGAEVGGRLGANLVYDDLEGVAELREGQLA